MAIFWVIIKLRAGRENKIEIKMSLLEQNEKILNVKHTEK